MRELTRFHFNAPVVLLVCSDGNRSHRISDGHDCGPIDAAIVTCHMMLEAAGNEVRELYLDGMDIASCKACEACSRNGGFCPQKDDMERVNDGYLWADVIVFASPMYWWTISGQLKTCVDRLYVIQNRIGYGSPDAMKETAFIMTARGSHYGQALDFYHIFTQIMGWKDWGCVLGAGKEDEARAMGAAIS